MTTKLVVDQSATEYSGFTCYREVTVAPFRIVSEAIEDGYYIVEIAGINSKMRRGYNECLATFGSFHRNGRTLSYVASVWQDENGEIEHPYNSEMLDDVYQLVNGQIEWMR